MSLSSMSAAFGQSSQSTKEESTVNAKPWMSPELQETFLEPVVTEPETDVATEPEVDIPDGMKHDPAMKEAMLADIQKDVTFAYDEETKTMTISGGEISQHTLDVLRGYMEMSDGEFDDANIVVGQDVTFRNSFKKDVRGEYCAAGPTFGDIKCKSIDIQSQNITNAYCMFASTKADIIKVADQPNLETAASMFSDCEAKFVSIGEFPESVYGNVFNPVFRGCSSIVVSKDRTGVIYSPFGVEDAERNLQDATTEADKTAIRGAMAGYELGVDSQMEQTEEISVGLEK